jgi:shikimate dehydrogenase
MDENQPKVFGIMGYPLAHSLSPLLHNRIYEAMGQKAVYKKFETRDPKACLDQIKALGVKGLCVTIPYKERVLSYLDTLHPSALEIGAVNTILNQEGRLVGYNTDGPGALRAIKEVMDLKGLSCLVVGAGGAARAVAISLRKEGARLYITNRSPENGLRLARDVQGTYLGLEALKGMELDLVVQATSLGMYPNMDAWPFDPEILKAKVVMEVIYNPLETKFLRRAKELGAKVILGYKMFVYQAMLQIRLFLGQDPPLELMEGITQEALLHHESPK